MISIFYQIIKDLFEGSEHRKIGAFSVQQIDRTIEEINRIKELDIREINERTLREKEDLDTKFHRNGVYNSGFRPAAHSTTDLKAKQSISHTEHEAQYAIDMLELEKQKLSVTV